MIKVKISYQDPEDLAWIMELLKPVTVSCKLSGNQQGTFRKVYVNIERSPNEVRAKQETMIAK